MAEDAGRHADEIAALARVLDRDGILAIPKASSPGHVAENRGAPDVRLTDEDRAVLDRAFPAPDRTHRLEIL